MSAQKGYFFPFRALLYGILWGLLTFVIPAPSRAGGPHLLPDNPCPDLIHTCILHISNLPDDDTSYSSAATAVHNSVVNGLVYLMERINGFKAELNEPISFKNPKKTAEEWMVDWLLDVFSQQTLIDPIIPLLNERMLQTKALPQLNALYEEAYQLEGQVLQGWSPLPMGPTPKHSK
ncbi:MAG: hypothetical protein ACK5PQ_05155 [Alphaproteobacteria bacterium]